MRHAAPHGTSHLEYLDELFDRLAALLKLEVYFHFVTPPDASYLELAAARGVSEEERKGLHRLELGQAVCGSVAASREPMVVTDAQRSTDPRTELIRSLGITAYASWPLLADGELLGTLSFGTRSDTRFTDHSLALLQSVCNYVAVSIRHRQVEAALAESEERFRVLVEATAQAVWEADPAGSVVSDSPSWLAYTGQTVEEWRRYGWLNAVHPEERDDAERRWKRALRDKSLMNTELRLRRAGGGWRHTNLRVVPLKNCDGSIRKWVGMNIDVTDRKEAERAREAELADMQRLQEIATRLIPEGDVNVLLEEILAAAIAIARADMGIVQMLEPKTGELVLATQRGLAQEYSNHFARISVHHDSCCATALEAGERIIVPDLESNDNFSGNRSGEVMLRGGSRAVQSTPLISRSGRALGVISTHWCHPHQPLEHELRLLDLLARQAADLIERSQSEAALRESEQTLRQSSRLLEQRVADRTAELREQARRLRNLASELASAEQRERKRLATVLHDNLQQLLIAAKLHLGEADALGESESTRHAVRKASQRLDEAAEAARELTSELRPPVLYEAGLGPALVWLASQMSERHGLRVAVDEGEGKHSLSVTFWDG